MPDNIGPTAIICSCVFAVVWAFTSGVKDIGAYVLISIAFIFGICTWLSFPDRARELAHKASQLAVRRAELENEEIQVRIELLRAGMKK